MQFCNYNPFVLAAVRKHLKYWVQFASLTAKRILSCFELLEHVQKRSTKVMKGLENEMKSDWWKWGHLIWRRGGTSSLFTTTWSLKWALVSFLKWRVIEHEEKFSNCFRGDLDWTFSRISPKKGWSRIGMICPVVVEFQSLETFKRCVDISLVGMVQWRD